MMRDNSSVGRALDSHSRGQGFDSPLFQFFKYYFCNITFYHKRQDIIITMRIFLDILFKFRYHYQILKYNLMKMKV